MNNYYQNYGEQCSSRDYNPNNYDLWQNSHYYNTNNFGLHNLFFAQNFGWSADSVGAKTPEKEPEVVDSKNRRIIPKSSLYEDPDAFYAKENSTNNDDSVKQSGYDWSKTWKKAGEETSAGSDVKTQKVKANALQKKLDKALSQPVKMSKAESMMQKMGWNGGALGKDGDGIVEPITPNAAYATKTQGFGQPEPETPKRFRITTSNNKANFKTNVLLHILEFVKNDTETEVVFDRRLTKEERKSVHKLVDGVVTGVEKEMAEDLGMYNHYLLGTQSEGTPPDRTLVLYKDAPAHVFLITPEDLIEIEEDTTENLELIQKSDTKRDECDAKVLEKVDVNTEEKTQDVVKDDEESNPFLRSITRNLREKDAISNKLEDCNITSENQPFVLRKITEYFIEFATNDEFTEFRFLGPFSVEDIRVLSGFVEAVRRCPKEGFDVFKVEKKKLTEIFSGKWFFDVNEDSNGSLMISKQTKDAAKEPDKL